MTPPWVDGAAWLRALLPSQCPLCLAVHAAPGWLCPDCRTALPRPGPACPRCAVPLPETRLCGACLRRPPPQSRTVAALRYAPPVDHLVQGLKFSARLGLAADLALCLEAALRDAGLPLPRVVTAVPLHRRRLAERGFDQAWLIARALARRLGLPARRGLCNRVRPTAVQSTLDGRARRRNVRGAFSARPLSGPVALVDDVMTTGSTAGEAARALLAAGASEVQLWVAARAGGQTRP